MSSSVDRALNARKPSSNRLSVEPQFAPDGQERRRSTSYELRITLNPSEIGYHYPRKGSLPAMANEDRTTPVPVHESSVPPQKKFNLNLFNSVKAISRANAGSWRNITSEKTKKWLRRAKSVLDVSLDDDDSDDESDPEEKFRRMLAKRKSKHSVPLLDKLPITGRQNGWRPPLIRHSSEVDNYDSASYLTCVEVQTNHDRLDPQNQRRRSSSRDRPLLVERNQSLCEKTKVAPVNAPPPPLDQLILNPNCPVHGIRKRIPSSNAVPKVRAPNLVYQERTHSQISIYDDEYLIKFIRMKRKQQMTRAQRLRLSKEKSKIIRNLLIISTAFLFLFSAFHGLQNLQTTINGSHGLGAHSLMTFYIGMIISCLFLPPYLLNRLGCKITLISCMLVYACYMLVNFAPKFYTLIPMSFFLGVAAAPLWAAKSTYLTEIGLRYAKLNIEDANEVVIRFFGIFYMILFLGQVFGNVISSLILYKVIPPRRPYPEKVDNSCGHYFINDIKALSEDAKRNMVDVDSAAVQSLCGAYFCCSLVAVLIVAIFLNQLRRDVKVLKEKPTFRLDIWHKTLEHIRKPRHIFLIPLTIFNGMEQAFIVGEFTKAFIGCCLGTANIGYVMTAFGCSNAVCCLVFGPLIKMFGRMPLFTFGAVVDMLMIFTLLIWPPNPKDTDLFYVVAACWGMADGVWNTQINSLWAVLFNQNLEVAYANYRLWESFGFVISFASIPYLATDTKLYILFAMLLIGVTGYFFIEFYDDIEIFFKIKQQDVMEYRRQRRENRRKSHSSVPRIGTPEIATPIPWEKTSTLTSSSNLTTASFF